MIATKALVAATARLSWATWVLVGITLLMAVAQITGLYLSIRR